MQITVNSNIAEFIKGLDEVAKRQIPFASAKALTETAKVIKAREEHEMRDVFDKPTPYTMNSLYLRPARKNNLVASVEIKDESQKGIAPSKFLTPQIYGGGRNLKRFELALRSKGVLPSGYFTTPGEGATLDAYGNMSRGQIIQILAYFDAFPEQGHKANMGDKGRAKLQRGAKRSPFGFAYFTVQPGRVRGTGRAQHLFPGIYKRVAFGRGSAIKPVLMFVSRAAYEPIFDFHYVAEITVNQEIDKQFNTAFTEALRTAR